MIEKVKGKVYRIIPWYWLLGAFNWLFRHHRHCSTHQPTRSQFTLEKLMMAILACSLSTGQWMIEIRQSWSIWSFCLWYATLIEFLPKFFTHSSKHHSRLRRAQWNWKVVATCSFALWTGVWGLSKLIRRLICTLSNLCFLCRWKVFSFYNHGAFHERSV